jgi:hypothetical protein
VSQPDDERKLGTEALLPVDTRPNGRHRHRKPNAAFNLALTRNVLLALIPFEQGQPLAHFFELYHRHPHLALCLILKASPVL